MNRGIAWALLAASTYAAATQQPVDLFFATDAPYYLAMVACAMRAAYERLRAAKLAAAASTKASDASTSIGTAVAASIAQVGCPHAPAAAAASLATTVRYSAIVQHAYSATITDFEHNAC